MPTYRLLGGAVRGKVLVYRHAYGQTAEELIDVCHKLLAEGWRVLRISPIDSLGDGFEPKQVVARGIEHFTALRRAVGEEIEIIFEVHTSLRSHTSVPIGTGEQLHDKWAYRELIERELIDYLRVDVCHTGGLTEGKKLAALAEAHYQELACHYTSSPVSTAAILHLNMAIPNCAVQEYAPPGGWMDEVFRHDLRTQDGYLLAPQAPGLGIDLDEEAIVNHPPAPHEPPHLRRPDGAVQDW